MEYRLEITRRALREAEEAHDWIARDSPQRAGRWYRELFRKIESLSTLPARCSLAPESDAVGQEVRQLLYGKRRNVYRILFVIQGDAVRILSIWHGARGSAEL